MTSTSEDSALTAAPRAPSVTGAAAVVTIALAGVLAAAFYALFWVEWRGNPDLTHAIFTPVFFLILLHESRVRGPWRWLPSSSWVTAVNLLALGVGLALLVAGGLYAAALDWSYALVGFVLATALAWLLLAALLGLAREGVRVIPFNWTAVVALALWPLSAPIPPGTYLRITASLQLWVSRVVLHAVHLFGVPAMRMGNVLTLAHTSVGVEEACSGVRSLVACLVAGLFFSATLVRRPAARMLLIALAGPLALAMNVLRSLLLTLLANAGVDIGGAWHDATGYAVFGVTAAILGALAWWLGHSARVSKPPVGAPLARNIMAGQASWSVPAGLALAVVLTLWFALSTQRSIAPASSPAAPDLASFLPATSPGWDEVTTPDLSLFTSQLQTKNLLQRNYRRRTGDGDLQITIYLAWWAAGQAPVSLVESHTPETCWPGTGWVQLVPASRPATLTIAGRALPAPTYLLFKNAADSPLGTWYWHLNAGRPVAQINPLSPRELLGLALRYGFHPSGEQWFVRISSNQPWEKIANEPLLTGLFARLQPQGL